MQGALILDPSVYTIIAERLGQGNFSSIGRFSSFRLVVKRVFGLPDNITQDHAQVYTRSQTSRREICILTVAI